MIVKDIKTGVQQGVDVNGRPFQQLSENTIASKNEKGQPNTPLIATGKMLEVYTSPKATRTNLVANVIPPKGKDRTTIGFYHNEGTDPYTITPKSAKMLAFKGQDGMIFTKKVNHPGLPKREWFGISEQVLGKIRKMLSIRLAEKLRQRPVTITR